MNDILILHRNVFFLSLITFWTNENASILFVFRGSHFSKKFDLIGANRG